MRNPEIGGHTSRKIEVAQYVAIGILGLSFLGLSCKVVDELREDRETCIAIGQIDNQGNRLEDFDKAKGCERFLKGRLAIPIHYGTGGW